MRHDELGLDLSGASERAAAAYQGGLDQLRCFVGDPLAAADQALADSPGMPMAHALRAWLHLLGTEPDGPAVALAACEAAAALPATERETLHLRAASALAQDRWSESARLLEDLSVRWPRDLLALQVGHQLDFFTGDSRMLRDRIARALPHWERTLPGYHALLSMHAFGLEETGDYAAAERAGREAVALEPRDGWGWHAVAHVHEMRHEPAAGTQWLGPTQDTWQEGSFLATHNAWHLALFHLALDDAEEVLRLYDRAIAGAGSSLMLDLVDASAMLWRLLLRGVDTGDRWQALAQRWQDAGVPGHYAFNDLHMMMAFVGAGWQDAQQRVLAAQDEALARAGDNARFTREVGAAATQAVYDFGQGHDARCARLLRDIRSRAHRFGGSHAQRDVIDLTLIEAARRAGDAALTRALEDERAAMRPHRPQRRVLAAAA
ncbi:tetratricopeptide repeat protein [Ramlibacter rhizophilus]|uniref:Tetratricopeptide repeat protein 38 n=1 Tax=Ramlibacter rhizophilus TaxID=1781167 RepID=A0A4Z0BY93_9BURK|nr:tetratricopeptide repeat protein [Ramlibacter rhizophilus]TFZ03268.1 tetratricopeptide repeat protein [Ramlibacter rhizophilus]